MKTGDRVGPYQIVDKIGAGGMSACGCGERAQRVEPRRVGVGPHARQGKQTPSPCR